MIYGSIAKAQKAKITDNVNGVERSFLECGSGSVTRVTATLWRKLTSSTVERSHRQDRLRQESHTLHSPPVLVIFIHVLKSNSFDWLMMMLITFE